MMLSSIDKIAHLMADERMGRWSMALIVWRGPLALRGSAFPITTP